MGDRKKPSPHSGATLERIIAAREHHKTREQRRAEAIERSNPEGYIAQKKAAGR